jgi:hypothetical protein
MYKFFIVFKDNMTVWIHDPTKPNKEDKDNNINNIFGDPFYS